MSPGRRLYFYGPVEPPPILADTTTTDESLACQQFMWNYASGVGSSGILF